MEWIFSPEQSPFNEIQTVAIAIREIRNNHRHIGILHRDDESEEVMLIHLRWHYDLVNAHPSKKYHWVKVNPNISERRLLQVSALCRLVWRENKKELPYALSHPSGCFNTQTGSLLLGPTQHGLTCSSFVLAIFHSVGLELIQYGTWPDSRDGDREWQQSVVESLEGIADDEHVEKVRSDIGALRFRPEEVAGAVTASPWPVDFDTAFLRSEKIIDFLGGK